MATTDSTGLRRSNRRVTPGASQRFVAATEQLENGAPVLGAAEDGVGELIVDLTGCSFLDSRGLGALNATRGRLEHELFEIHPSLAAAVNGNGNGNGNGHG